MFKVSSMPDRCSYVLIALLTVVTLQPSALLAQDPDVVASAASDLMQGMCADGPSIPQQSETEMTVGEADKVLATAEFESGDHTALRLYAYVPDYNVTLCLILVAPKNLDTPNDVSLGFEVTGEEITRLADVGTAVLLVDDEGKGDKSLVVAQSGGLTITHRTESQIAGSIDLSGIAVVSEGKMPPLGAVVPVTATFTANTGLETIPEVRTRQPNAQEQKEQLRAAELKVDILAAFEAYKSCQIQLQSAVSADVILDCYEPNSEVANAVRDWFAKPSNEKQSSEIAAPPEPLPHYTLVGHGDLEHGIELFIRENSEAGITGHRAVMHEGSQGWKIAEQPTTYRVINALLNQPGEPDMKFQMRVNGEVRLDDSNGVITMPVQPYPVLVVSSLFDAAESVQIDNLRLSSDPQMFQQQPSNVIMENPDIISAYVAW